MRDKRQNMYGQSTKKEKNEKVNHAQKRDFFHFNECHFFIFY